MKVYYKNVKNRIKELQKATLSFMKDRNLKKGLETINLAIDLDNNIAINRPSANRE